jgi:hypothetical protein
MRDAATGRCAASQGRPVCSVLPSRRLQCPQTIRVQPRSAAMPLVENRVAVSSRRRWPTRQAAIAGPSSSLRCMLLRQQQRPQIGSVTEQQQQQQQQRMQ